MIGQRLGFHGREVLHVVAEEPAKVLDESVEQRREVQRIPGGPAVVVAVRVGGRAVAAHTSVAPAGQRDEHRRPERRPVRGRVRLADRPGRYLAPGQVRRVLPSSGRPVPAGRSGRQHLSAHAGVGDLLVQLAVERIQLGRVLVLVPGPVTLGLGLGPLLDQPALPVVRIVRVNDRLMIEMPAFPALGRPERPGTFGARSADRGQRVPARNEDLFHSSRADSLEVRTRVNSGVGLVTPVRFISEVLQMEELAASRQETLAEIEQMEADGALTATNDGQPGDPERPSEGGPSQRDSRSNIAESSHE